MKPADRKKARLTPVENRAIPLRRSVSTITTAAVSKTTATDEVGARPHKNWGDTGQWRKWKASQSVNGFPL